MAAARPASRLAALLVIAGVAARAAASEGRLVLATAAARQAGPAARASGLGLVARGGRPVVADASPATGRLTEGGRDGVFRPQPNGTRPFHDPCGGQLEEAEKALERAAASARGSVAVSGTGARAARLAANVLKDHEESESAERAEVAKLNSTLSSVSAHARSESASFELAMHGLAADLTAVKRLKAEWSNGSAAQTTIRNKVLASAVADARKGLDDLESKERKVVLEEQEAKGLQIRVLRAERALARRASTGLRTGLEEALRSAGANADAVATLTGRVVVVLWREKAVVEQLRQKRQEPPARGRRKAIDEIVMEVVALERLRTSATDNRTSAIAALSDDVAALGEAAPPALTAFLASATETSLVLEEDLREASESLQKCANKTVVAVRRAQSRQHKVQERIHAQLRRVSKYRLQGVVNPLDPRAMKPFGEQAGGTTPFGKASQSDLPGAGAPREIVAMPWAPMIGRDAGLNKARKTSAKGSSVTTGAPSSSDRDAAEEAAEAKADDQEEAGVSKLTKQLEQLKALYNADNEPAGHQETPQEHEASERLEHSSEALPDEVADAVRRLAKELKDVK